MDLRCFAPFARMLLFAGGFSTGATAHAQPERPKEPTTSSAALVQKLLRRDSRDAAFCELTRRAGETPDEDCRVNHVVAAKGRAGQALYIIFEDADFARDYAKPGEAKGPFRVMTADGRFLPIFEGANVIDEGSALIGFGGKGQLALALNVNCEGLVQTLHIVPVEDPSLSVLSLKVGPPGETVEVGELVGEMECIADVCTQLTEVLTEDRYPWTWRARRQRGSRPTIDIGPRDNLARGRPAASFRWNNKLQQYEGPKGGAGFDFERLDPKRPCCE